ncbi:MAG: GNAT family N-acetyltransferase [Ancalomicrobiaceae bacterium]|nr:GNAT family N-acetyltransferase [Ancalomicrobiaceae bacterium]
MSASSPDPSARPSAAPDDPAPSVVARERAPAVAIVPLAAEHLSALVDLWVASWAKTMSEIDFEARRPWLVEHIGRLEADGVAIRVALDGSVPMGFVTVDPDDGHLDQLCVAPDGWGKGVAEALVDTARRLSPAGLHLAVNADNRRAIRFYQRQGFVETGRGSNSRSGLPIVFMAWPGSAGDDQT